MSPDRVWSQDRFPAPPGSKDYPNVLFTDIDGNEDYLDLFDRQGVKVWLQVEPADAEVEILVDLVLGRYASNPSVAGLSIDDEWYKNREYPDGKAVTDAEAQAWLVGAVDVTDMLQGPALEQYRLSAATAPLVFQVAEAGDRVAVPGKRKKLLTVPGGQAPGIKCRVAPETHRGQSRCVRSG